MISMADRCEANGPKKEGKERGQRGKSERAARSNFDDFKENVAGET